MKKTMMRRHAAGEVKKHGTARVRIRRLIRAAGFAGLAVGMSAATLANAKDMGPSKPFDFTAWDQYLGGGDSSQYSSLKQINKSNVTKLQIAWTFELGRGPTPNFNPTIVGNALYALGPKNSIVALDAATGKVIWSHANKGRVGNRGINQWVGKDGKDRRLFYINNGKLTSLDAKTGKTITSFGDNGEVDLRVGLDRPAGSVRPLQTNNPGRVYKNLIIISLPAGGSFGYGASPADIHAYDVHTGKLKWVFHTIPAPGEFGADTLPKNGRSWIGGGHNWSESTIDRKNGIIFIPTGTARYDFYGGDRKGNDLFGNSLIAIDANTGKRLWHFQTVHHDLWDYDNPEAPKLLTVMHDGKKVDAVALATKTGFVYVFNRLHRKAAMADQGNAGPEVGRAGRIRLADPAHPDRAASFRAPEDLGKGYKSVSLGRGSGEGQEDLRRIALRHDLHPAEPAGHDCDSWAPGRRELGRIGCRPDKRRDVRRRPVAADIG